MRWRQEFIVVLLTLCAVALLSLGVWALIHDDVQRLLALERNCHGVRPVVKPVTDAGATR